MNQQLNILLVEDDDVDVMNVRRAFSKNHITNPLFVASDGVEALEKLRGGEVPKGRRLVLLDLNMPRMNGIDFLTLVKSYLRLASIPVLVVSRQTEKLPAEQLRTRHAADDVWNAVHALMEQPEVEYAEPDAVMIHPTVELDEAPGKNLPRDWHLRAIRAPQAWRAE